MLNHYKVFLTDYLFEIKYFCPDGRGSVPGQLPSHPQDMGGSLVGFREMKNGVNHMLWHSESPAFIPVEDFMVMCCTVTVLYTTIIKTPTEGIFGRMAFIPPV